MIYHIYWGTSGNAGLYLDEIFQCLKSEGYRQKVFVSYYYPFDYGEKIFFRHSDIAHCRIKGRMRIVIQLWEIIISFFKIILFAWKDKPSIVNYSLISGSYLFVFYFLCLIKKISGCKLVVTCHDVIPFGQHTSDSTEMRNRKKIFDMADFLLVHNDSSIVDLETIFGESRKKMVKHLFPIMDLSKLHKDNVFSKRCDFLFIGHLRKDKGIQFLLDSWHDFHILEKDATLWVCGNPIGKTFDVEYYKKDNVTLNLSYVSEDDYCRYIQSARYVVLPYLKGTNSGIISTAMSLGADVITSDIPMFLDNPLVNRDCIFKSGDTQSLLEILRRKFLSKDNNKIEGTLNEYRKQFAVETIAAYRTIMK